jgi:hypothetical protein
MDVYLRKIGKGLVGYGDSTSFLNFCKCYQKEKKYDRIFSNQHTPYLNIFNEPHKMTIDIDEKMVYGYINYYINTYGDLEYYKIDRKKIDKPYIVFQYKNKYKNPERNTNNNDFNTVFNYIKSLLCDNYDFILIGEGIQLVKGFSKKMTFSSEQLNEFIQFIRNSSLLVVSDSGINQVAMLFEDVPTFNICVRKSDVYFDSEKWRKNYYTDMFDVGNRYLENYKSKTFGGKYTSGNPPDIEFLSKFLKTNGLI